MRILSTTVLTLLLAGSTIAADEQPPAAGPSLKDAPANAWVKLDQAKTGRREQPIFVYVPTIKRFVAAAGIQSTGGRPPRHYDTEEFDLSADKWINAYPAGTAEGRPESGPVGEDYSKAREHQGWNGPEPFYKDGDSLRLGAGTQWSGFRTCYEWCYDPDNAMVYAYLGNMTLRYDPAKRTWEDLKAKPRASCGIWGSMCYDPVNKEIVHAGGDGGTLEIGTWVYSVDKNEWRKLELGSAAARALCDQADALCWQAKALLGATVNRFAVSETDAEAKADLKAKAAELVEAGQKLAAAIQSADLKGAEKSAAAVAAKRVGAAGDAVKAVADKLGGAITPEIIGEVRAARVLFEKVVDALAVEPTGRARSQIAYDPADRKIVLFGGDQLDRALSDTWVYDCATRTWEQRFPDICPTPRAGHILAWLPKAGRIVLAGGYSRIAIPQQIWSYDAKADRWTPLMSASGANKGAACPYVDARDTQVGAVTEDDLLVCVQSGNPGRTTWAVKVDPSKALADVQDVAGTSGEYTFNRIDPADWEKVANPDAAATKKLYEQMPANQWTSMKFARYAPGARNRWGTTAYDTDRHQFLFWGGGHATSHENDVAHYSVLSNCWTLGYHPDDPIETVYASQPTPISFHNRAHVPVHAYRAYSYDPSVHKMFYFGRAYDPAVREWEARAYPGLQDRGTMHSQMEATPQGAVTYSNRGLFRFDGKANRWDSLPWTGPNPGGIWCDGDTLLYDSKRNCLWFANKKDIIRYDLAKGAAEKVAFQKPKALGEFTLWCEQVYLPDADLVLLMRLFPKPDGSVSPVVWDPGNAKFYWASLKFVESGKEQVFKANPFSWHDAIRYDPALKLVLLNNSSASKVWVLKFDKATAGLEEVKE
ncbi:MAG: hypothetical protein BIFFINMI_00336 [Phycisphaerae bacterium]|nr:hypothetical protein [Phycisphaerae bacterium]